MISFSKAQEIVSAVGVLGTEAVNPTMALGRVLSEDVRSFVDSPPRDSSLKDGFALRAADIENASPENPITLKVTENLCAGQEKAVSITSSQAVRIMTGATIPQGADAVLPQELTSYSEDKVLCLASTSPGRNILSRGADLKKGEVLVRKGARLDPGLVGLLVGAGVTRVQVFSLPRVVIVATGSEIAEEGAIDESYKIFPSNRATIASWLRLFGMKPQMRLCRDEAAELRRLLAACIDDFDVIITSGGVLDGERDLVVATFEELGAEFLFKRVRMGPGKGVCMGRIGRKLVFNLPGGPPSNYVAFLFVALPAILRLMGEEGSFPPIQIATLTADLKGRADWTQLILSKTGFRGGSLFVSPVVQESRLKRIAFSNSVVIIPEGVSFLKAGDRVKVSPFKMMASFPW